MDRCVIFALHFALASSVFADPGAFDVGQVEVGLGGWVKLGEPSSARVEVKSAVDQSLTLVVECTDVDDNRVTFPGAKVALAAGESQRLETPFIPGRLRSDLHLSLADSVGKVVWNRRLVPVGPRESPAEAEVAFHEALRPEVPLWVTLVSLPEMPALETGTEAAALQPRLVTWNSIAQLPNDWRAYRPANLVVLPCRAEADDLSLAAMSKQQSAALRTWVEQGGHLLLSLSSMEAVQNSPLGAWIPLQAEGEVSLRQFINLESYAGKGSGLRAGTPIRIPRLTGLANRNVLVRDLGGAPLVDSVPLGLGRVSSIQFDLASPLLANWAGLPSVLSKISGLNARGGRQAESSSSRKLSQVGVSDLATQWLQTNDVFGEISRPTYWWVMMLLLGVVALVGPLDYLLVHRVIKRPELTWITFPLISAVCVGLAARYGNSSNGSQLRINEIDVVDLDVATGVVRGQSWVLLYSPEHRRFAVEVVPESFESGLAAGRGAEVTLPAVQLYWTGMPENAVGGLYRAAGAASEGRRYALAPGQKRLENLPVLQWSTRGLRCDWQDQLDSPPVQSQLQSSGIGQVTGTITHQLPGTLEDCLLVVGNWAYFPKNESRSLEPGVAWQPAGPRGTQRELKALLTGEKRTRYTRKGQVDSEVLTSLESWNPLSRDLSDIMRMITFHQAAGGTEYSGLKHAALRDLELTPLTLLGRGVLIGRLETPVARVQVDGQPADVGHRTTFVRLVVPVVQLDRAAPNVIPKLNEPTTTTSF